MKTKIREMLRHTPLRGGELLGVCPNEISLNQIGVGTVGKLGIAAVAIVVVVVAVIIGIGGIGGEHGYGWYPDSNSVTSPDELNTYLNRFDADKDNEISWSEFCTLINHADNGVTYSNGQFSIKNSAGETVISTEIMQTLYNNTLKGKTISQCTDESSNIYYGGNYILFSQDLYRALGARGFNDLDQYDKDFVNKLNMPEAIPYLLALEKHGAEWHIITWDGGVPSIDQQVAWFAAERNALDINGNGLFELNEYCILESIGHGYKISESSERAMFEQNGGVKSIADMIAQKRTALEKAAAMS